MPVGYGQLGCSGFIVVDTKGNFISRKTKAYLDYGEDAFDDVERLLDDELKLTAVGKKPVQQSIDRGTSASEMGSVEDEKKEDQKVKKKQKTTNKITSIEPPPSTGVAAMDHEHDECTNAINALLKNPTTDALSKVVEILKEHFKHEEKLMESHGFDGSNDTFSPLVSHRKDHERILDIGRNVLSMTCSSSDGGSMSGKV